MEKYTLTKQQLIEFADRQIQDKTIVIKEIMPTKDMAIRVTKNEVNGYIEHGENHNGYVELVPINDKKQKIYRLTAEQFGKILIFLKTNFPDNIELTKIEKTNIN